MGLFGRIFGRHDSKIQTSLETFLATITLDQPRQTYRSVTNVELRLPAAISTLTLHVVHKFCEGLSRLIKDTQHAAKAPNVPFLYDVAAFEAAAYCHYWLMKPYLQVGDDGDEDDKGDDYFECLKDATHVTNAALASRTKFGLVDDFLLNRVISYSQPSIGHEVPERFASALISALRKGTPGSNQIQRGREGEGLPMELAVVSYVPIFHQTYLDALPKTARALFLADREGLLK